MDTVDDEIRRSRRIKAIESYAESAPQMILQIFILCRRVCSEEMEKSDGNFLITSMIHLGPLNQHLSINNSNSFDNEIVHFIFQESCIFPWPFPYYPY